jgi:hypothetical protein
MAEEIVLSSGAVYADQALLVTIIVKQPSTTLNSSSHPLGIATILTNTWSKRREPFIINLVKRDNFPHKAM